LHDAERELLKQGGRVWAGVCDVGDPVALDGFLESAGKCWGVSIFSSTTCRQWPLPTTKQDGAVT